MIQYFINNEFVLYPTIAVTAGIFGYFFLKLYINSPSYVEKGVQTDSG